MSALAPSRSYHAQLRDQLGLFGRALTLQRAIRWATRAVLVGVGADAAGLGYLWVHAAARSLPPLVWLLPPAILLLAGLVASTFVRTPPERMAAYLDRLAHLQERSVTALELGGRAADRPLQLAQMRDALEHIQRLEPVDLFPLRVPRREALAALLAAALAAGFFVAPVPRFSTAPSHGAASAAVAAQAQKLAAAADRVDPGQVPQLSALRQLLDKGAQTLSGETSDPLSASQSLRDVEQQLKQMAQGDQALSQALAAAADALAANPQSAQLSQAVRSGDMRQVAQAARQLGQQAGQLSPSQRAQLAATLQAAAKAAQGSPEAASDLSAAANALQSGANGAGQSGAAQASGGAQQSLDQLASSADAAAARQDAANQLAQSQAAIQSALSQDQQGASSATTSSSARDSSASAGSQQSDGSGSSSSAAGGADQTGDSASGSSSQGGGPGQGGQGNQPGGSGYGTGTANHQGDSSRIDTVQSQQRDTSGRTAPDTASTNPFLSGSGTGSSHAQEQNVSPSYSSGPTQGGGSDSIPLGLQDIVKSYFGGQGHN